MPSGLWTKDSGGTKRLKRDEDEQYKLEYIISNNIDAYDEPVPRTKKIHHHAVKSRSVRITELYTKNVYCEEKTYSSHCSDVKHKYGRGTVAILTNTLSILQKYPMLSPCESRAPYQFQNSVLSSLFTHIFTWNISRWKCVNFTLHFKSTLQMFSAKLLNFMWSRNWNDMNISNRL